MKINSDKISAIPTNIITGFLGVGKTSFILQLLQRKPSHEKWAILVNEFGEIGVDGSLIQGQFSQNQGVYIREVPGGCMCCAAGVPMQVALNQLLTHAKPDRLLIEPTGLGHPKQILKVLSAAHYHKVLQLQNTFTLVDARKLSDSRYTSHDIFNQQIAIADIVVGNKVDLYQQDDKIKLESYVKAHGKTNAETVFAQQEQFPESLLVDFTAINTVKSKLKKNEPLEKTLTPKTVMPECGYIKASNNGEGFNSVGWRFSSNKIFNYNKLFAYLSDIRAERIKAVFKTNKGTFGYNYTTDGLTEVLLNDGAAIQRDNDVESSIEIIGKEIDDTLEIRLFNCLEHK